MLSIDLQFENQYLKAKSLDMYLAQEVALILEDPKLTA